MLGRDPDGAAGGTRDRGVSLVEVMVAMALFMLGSLSLLSVLVSTTNGNADNRARVTAANLAAQDIDLVRSLPYADVQTTSTPLTQTIGGRVYTIERQVEVTPGTVSSTSACVSSGGPRPLYKRVSTKVTTTFRGRVLPVRADTLVRAPAYAAADPTTRGAIGFLVMDRNSQPLNGLSVTAAGQTLTTDTSGCSFFDGVAAGEHTVTVTRDGSVTRTSRTPLSRTVRVVAGQITSDSIRVDTSVPVRLRVEVMVGGTSQIYSAGNMPTNLPARLATPDRSTSTRLLAESAPLVTSAPVVHTWNAFPAAAGYEAFLGRCSPPVFQTFAEPGTTPPQGTLHLTPVQVVLSGFNSADAPKTQNKTVTVKWRTAECAETLTYTTVTTSTCSPTSNGSDQCRITIAVPPGDWRFTIATPGSPPVESSFVKDFVVPTNPSSIPTVKIDV